MTKSATSHRERAYAYVRDVVLSDPKFHGTFLTEDQVADEVKVSRTPVREAFLLLAAAGLIDLVPRHGAFIPPISDREIDEVLDFRALIETRAAALSLRAGRAPVDAMQEALDRQKERSAAGNEREFSELDNEFHIAQVRAAGNTLMTRAYVDLRSRHVRIGVRALTRTAERQAAVIAEHQAIVDGLRSGVEATAIDAIEEHIASTRRGLSGSHAGAAPWSSARSAS